MQNSDEDKQEKGQPRASLSPKRIRLLVDMLVMERIMRLMTITVAWLGMIACTVAGDASPQELIQRLIQAEYTFAYNPTNTTSDELIKADALNAELRLKAILLASSDEELKTCYALRLVNQSIVRIEDMIRKNAPTTMDLRTAINGPMAQRAILVKYLQEIRKTKAELGAAPLPSAPAGASEGAC